MMNDTGIRQMPRQWYRPGNLHDALAIRDERRPVVLCGGTDLFVNWPRRVAASVEPVTQQHDWLQVDTLAELHQIQTSAEGLLLGAAVTASEIRSTPEVAPLAALRQAARIVGGWQIQNRASIGGNLANASPAADMVLALSALDAHIELASAHGMRRLAVTDFLLGPRRTALGPDELITRVIVPAPALAARQYFFRLDQHAASDISLVAVALTATVERDEVTAARIAVGAANPVPLTLPEIDRSLLGRVSEKQIEAVAAAYAERSQPISDVRASERYRRGMVRALVRRGLREVLYATPQPATPAV